LAAVLASIRVHGKGTDKYDNIRVGINGRLDTLQAAILLSKLEIFPEELQFRQQTAQRYREQLKHIVKVPEAPRGYRSAWAQFSVLHETRDVLMAALKAQSVPTAIYYPTPLHLLKAFAMLGYTKGSFPQSEYIAQRIFSLPMHPYLSIEDQDSIIKAIHSAC
jgi:UDP-2-acetamido-2-deoxy-ribo-hexuluronate aminotransferase